MTRSHTTVITLRNTISTNLCKEYIMMELSPQEETFVSVDAMIQYIGAFKRYQWMLCFAFCVIMLPMSYQVLIMMFLAQHQTWKCVDNSTLCKSNGTFSPLNTTRCYLPRNEWEFTDPKEYSIASTFDIYCGNEWQIALSTSIVLLGVIIGSVFVGWAADTFGRRLILFISILVVLVSGLLSSFMPNIYLFMCLRFCLGLFGSGVNQMSIFLSELVDPSYRPLAGILIWCLFPVGVCLLCVKAYFIRNWRTLMIMSSAPYFFVILFYKCLPESPRWLRLHGKIDEASKVFAKIASFNKTTIPPHIRLQPVTEVSKAVKTNPLALFKNCKTALQSFNLGFAALCNGMIFYGLTLAAGGVGDSLYVDVFLLSLIDIPAGICSIISSHRLGRKKTTVMAMFMNGAACLALAFLPGTIRIWRIILGMTGKFFISVSFNVLFLWIIELYPTTHRGQAIGYGAITSTLGSASSPWIIQEFGFNPAIPYIFMGVAAILSSGLLLFLSETKGLPTLEVEDEEDIDYTPDDSDGRAALLETPPTANI